MFSILHYVIESWDTLLFFRMLDSYKQFQHPSYTNVHILHHHQFLVGEHRAILIEVIKDILDELIGQEGKSFQLFFGGSIDVDGMFFQFGQVFHQILPMGSGNFFVVIDQLLDDLFPSLLCRKVIHRKAH